MQKKGYFYLGVTTIAFSTMELVGKMVAGDFHPLQLTFLRFAIGSLVLLPFALYELKRRKHIFTLKEILYFTILGILCIPVSMGTFQIAISKIKASMVALIISSNAVFVAPLAVVILKEKINRNMLAALVMGVLGVTVVANPFALAGAGSINLAGIAYAVVAAVTFAMYTVLGKKVIAEYGGLIINTFVFIIGNACLMILLLDQGIPLFRGINAGNFGEVLYLGIFVTGIGYIAFFKGLELTTASKGSVIFFIKPVLAPLLAFLFLHETITPTIVIGAGLVLAGTFFMFRESPVKLKPQTMQENTLENGMRG